MKSRLFPQFVFLALLAVSLFGIGFSVQKSLLEFSRTQLNRYTQFESISFSLFEFPPAVRIENLKGRGELPWIKAAQADLLFDFSGIDRGKIKFRKLQLLKPQIEIVKGAAGKWNVSQGFPAPVVEIQQGSVIIRDESGEGPPLTVSLEQIEGVIEEDAEANTVHFRGRGVIPALENLGGAPVVFDAEYAPSSDALAIHVQLGKNEEIEVEAECIAITGEVGFSGKVEVRKLNLRDWVNPQGALNEFGEGILTAHFDFGGQGFRAEDFTRYFAANGSIDVRDGTLRGIQFVQNILGQMTPLKGLESLLKEPVPEPLRGLIQNPHTPFSIMQANLQFSRGRFFADEVVLQHPDFMIQADGSFSVIEKDVDFRAKLVLLPKLSEALVERGRSLLLMRNKEGRVVIPFLYRGLLPGAMTYPDLSLLTNTVVAKEDQKLPPAAPKETILDEKII